MTHDKEKIKVLERIIESQNTVIDGLRMLLKFRDEEKRMEEHTRGVVEMVGKVMGIGE